MVAFLMNVHVWVICLHGIALAFHCRWLIWLLRNPVPPSNLRNVPEDNPRLAVLKKWEKKLRRQRWVWIIFNISLIGYNLTFLFLYWRLYRGL